ncbi:MAG: hypothetical protein DHS20C19_28760 [Acidimicrobiales bacterium]|nr:MAG: hypothetical protein DHS20C19_28760 [Acidimicrobiales bacterium]
MGGPGNGKTTLARELASRLGLDHIELDSLFHVVDFASATDDEFRAGLVARMDAAPQGWVACGNYHSMTEGLHTDRADTVIWLDQSRALVTWRTAKRTVRRALTRQKLFGNDIREPLTNFTRWDPEKNIIRWAWVHHPIYREKTPAYLARPECAHLTVHHLTDPAEVAAFLESVPVADR